MFEMYTKHDTVKIYAATIEDEAMAQITQMANSPIGENAHVRIMPDAHAGKGCTIGTTMKITDKVCPNVVGVDIGCLDKDTEFLTENGWKSMDSFELDDSILQYDKDTDKANFAKPLAYIVKDCDSFYHFKNSKGLDQMVSEEHKMLIWKGFKGRGYSLHDMKPLDLLSMNLDRGYYGIKTSFQLDSEGLAITNEEIRLDIMVSADGTVRAEYTDSNRIELHFSKERKITRARTILDDCSIAYQEYHNSDQTTTFSFYVPKYINKDLSKYWRANTSQLKIVTEECLLWDGHLGYRSFFSSTNKRNAEVIQFAFSAINIRAGISIQEHPDKNWSSVYIVTPTKNNIIGVCSNIGPVMTMALSIDKKKYCFTTETGYFIARRNGKIFITGNCGVTLAKTDIDFGSRLKELDLTIRKLIPFGHSIYKDIQIEREYFKENLLCWDKLNDAAQQNAMRSCGSLGGGNHFIEAYEDGFISVHSGSRNLGLQIAKYYQSLAESMEKSKRMISPQVLQSMPGSERGAYVAKLHAQPVYGDLAFLEGDLMQQYLHDADFATKFAQRSRDRMLYSIVNHMGSYYGSMIVSTHNYISKDGILRKGAIEAKEGQKLVIPLSMRDGMLICTGKGNEDWNYSAPHGAGRLYSRTKAKALFTLEEYKKSMEGIFSTCINTSTLDESPFAYKNWEEIADLILPTVDIEQRIIPIFNFKAN